MRRALQFIIGMLLFSAGIIAQIHQVEAENWALWLVAFILSCIGISMAGGAIWGTGND